MNLYSQLVISFPGFEFRGFVYRRKLNALTQYFEAIYVPELVNTKDEIEEAIFNLFEKLEPLLNVHDYVIDFALLD